jgi:hypothetical protein
MKTTQIIYRSVISLIVITMLPGCASKKNTWGDARKGFNLEYRMPETGQLQYDHDAAFTSGMEVMGQTIEVSSNSKNLFTMQTIGQEKGNYELNVTIDTAYIQFQSPRGEMKPDMDKVIGKDFLFVVSPKGRVVDCSGAEELTYSLGESEELNIASDFKTLFPNLPDRSLKIGEKWNNIDTLVEKGSSGSLRFISFNEHLLESMEPFEGYDCLKIKTTYSGTMDGEGNIQGAATKTEGTIEGEYTWYFAYKEGIFIQVKSKGLAKSVTEVSGEGREMSIPSTRDFSSVTNLVQ